MSEDGAALIAAERRRQVEQEGWAPDHDDRHTDGEMARAAACYALAASAPFWATRLAASDEMRGAWPIRWDFKQADPVRMLAKAGALIAAEIDRLQRRDPAIHEARHDQPACGGPRHMTIDSMNGVMS